MTEKVSSRFAVLSTAQGHLRTRRCGLWVGLVGRGGGRRVKERERETEKDDKLPCTAGGSVMGGRVDTEIKEQGDNSDNLS